jgi:rubredoxin-NAD+ reductase
MPVKKVVIIGSGLAGYTVARQLRQLEPNIKLHMLSADGGAFYSKPLLSTALVKQKTPQALMMMSADKMRAQLAMQIDTHTQVLQINPQDKSIQTQNETVHYDALILALGANTPKPPLAGDATDQLLHVNDVYQYDHFRQQLADKKHVTLLGAGLVGCEFANDLSLSGYHVSAIDAAKHVISHLLPKPVSQGLEQALSAQGVELYLKSQVTTVNHHQKRLRVTLDNGQYIDTDLVLSAIGLRPQLALAQAAGLKTQRGIVVNRYLQSSDPAIFALGDCAEVEGLLLPYVAPISHAAKAIAHTLTKDTPLAVSYPAMPMVIKTTCYPITACFKPPFMQDNWTIEKSDQGVRALNHDANGELQGFVLSQGHNTERMALLAQMSAWL